MKHIAWVHKQTKAVHNISTYGDGVGFVESDTSLPIEVQPGNIPTIGMIYKEDANTFIPPPPKKQPVAKREKGER